MKKKLRNGFLHRSGWEKLFPFPVWADVLLMMAFGAGLIWVFVNGLEQWWPAYILYGLSAYSLTALCIKLPCGCWNCLKRFLPCFLCRQDCSTHSAQGRAGNTG